MKKQVTVVKSFCDVCGKEASGYSNCIVCGKEFCYDCKKTDAIEYTRGVHFLGSGDGLYCLKCNKKAIESGDKLNAAYRLIMALRNEVSGFYSDFNERSKKAEKVLETLLGKRESMVLPQNVGIFEEDQI